MMDNLSTSDDVCKDDMSENNDADSNSSEALATENKNKQSKKKSLNDMLKKLNPRVEDSTASQGLPLFLQKNSQALPLEMTCSSDPELSHTLEPSTSNSSKTVQDSKPGSSTVLSTQARVSSPKSSAEVYRCYVDTCSLAFSQISDFKQHIHSMHQDVLSIPCCFCYSTYKRENILDHLALHIKNVMKCIYCQVSQDTREELLKHLGDKHPNQPKKINVCIRILNNVRSKKISSEQNSEPKAVIKICPSIDSSRPIDESSISEVPKSRKTRKAAKPLKTQFTLATDEIEIQPFDKELHVNCDQCTFCCNGDKLLKQHLQEDHLFPCTKSSLFKCKQCKMVTDCKDTFTAHLAHHKGSHTLRCYLCPYCTVVSNSMDTIEDHIGEKHPSEVFRFEVLQEKIDHLQNMLTCPICNGGFVWQKSFLSHLESVHQLTDVVEYLSKNYIEKSLPEKAKVPRSFFRNLLPDAPDYDMEHLGEGECIPKDDISQTCHKEEPKEPTSILEAHLIGNNSQDEDYSAIYNEGVDYNERFPPADLSQYVIKKGTPTTFSCDMCPFECVKTAHFRRHLEVHRRNESLTEGYRCGYCQFMHNRLNCIRFHLGKYHSDKPYKMTRIVDNSIISYGPEDDPTLGRSKAKRPFLTSTPNNEKEKKSIKFEPCSPTTEDDLQAILQFEKQLPTAMIYQDPIKCPKCDFSNRVRINLLRHLKLHKEERLLNGSLGDLSVSGQLEGMDEKNAEGDERKNKVISNPFLEFLTNTKSSSCDGDFLEDAEEVTFVSRTDLTDEYKYFSIKLPNGNQYQCKECKFIHRYPSKVKRHYYYKHAPAFPFKCGYCSFGAVESGKVKRHCKLVHKHKREMVIKRNVYKKESQNAFHQSVDVKKEEVAVQQDIEDGVKVTNEVITSSTPDSSGDLWLSQFVTMLDDDVQCCKLCGYQQEGSSSLRDHVFCMHLEFYPYSCTYCGFALMDIFRVKKHIDMHHAGMSYVAVRRQIRDDSADHSGREMVVDESSQFSFEDGVKKEMDEEDEDEDGSRDHNSLRDVMEDSDTNGANSKRQFKCHYCGVISKWNRRDIRLHILHVHLKKKVYTCRHCGFGNSKSKAIVKSHCVKFHPSKNVSVRDELVLFNAIIPIDDSNSIVTMALSNKDGSPILELPKEDEPDKTLAEVHPIKVENKVTRSSGSFNNSSTSSSRNNNSYLKSDRWKCKECSYASNSEIDVKYHLIASHMNLKPYSCPHCHLYMNKVDSVTSHIDRVHPGKHKNVVNTIEEKSIYLQKNMECLFSKCNDGPLLNEDEDVIDADFARIMEQQTNPRYSSGYFRCLICGYRDPRNDKTKYHIIKNHLNLRQFSCPHCNVYMWGRQQVIIHIEEVHPGKEVFVKRTFQEYDEFLRKSIKRFPYPRSLTPSHSNNLSVKITTRAIPRIYCNSCSFVTDSELSLAAHKRTHKIFQCFYCDFKHMLAARVQSHCLARHPYKLVRFKQINSSNFESTKVDSSDVCEGNSEESEVEFEKDEGDGADTSKAERLRNKENGTYICQHCQVVKWSKNEISKHLEDSHPGNTPAYTFIKTKLEESIKNLLKKTSNSTMNSENGMDDEDLDEMEIDNHETELPIKMNNIQNTKFSNLSSQLCKSRASLYQCRLCTYKSNKMTVMRHHIMSHLRYHPYICPYCDVARSVKSFPIKKHVIAKHPGKEVRSLHCINEEIEKKIANSYYKLKLSSLAEDNFLETPETHLEEEEEDGIEDPGSMDEGDFVPCEPPTETTNPNRFKCKFCSYETSFRTDMKHHLMKEINYKPLKCTICSYADTQRPVFSKHFQVKHPDTEVRFNVEINGEKEELVNKMLEETCIKKESQESSETSHSPRQVFHNTRFSASQRSSISSPPSQTSPLLKQPDPIPLRSNPKMLKCPECSYTNSSMKLVRGHMIKHGPYRFKCSYCDYHAHYPSRIRKHTKTQHQGLTFKFTKITDFSNTPSSNKGDLAHPNTNHPDSSGNVYLDGVVMDLPCKAHSDGWFRCQYCDYKSLDRDNFKVHLVTHKPPRWKCFHCNQRYPVVFRVRRHCLTKHPRLPIKWMDVETGRVYSSSRSSSQQVSNSLFMQASTGSGKLGTARKSLGDDRLAIESKSSRLVVRTGSGDGTVMRFSCHLCNFSEFSNTTSSLLKHLKVEHFWSDKLPSIEILPTGDEGEVWALRRCGFCAFETYNSDTFRCHVLEHTIRPPVQCVFCSFASFSRSVVIVHARREHSSELKGLETSLKEEQCHDVKPDPGQPEDIEMKDVEIKDVEIKDVEIKDVEIKDVEMKDVEMVVPDDSLFIPDNMLFKELQDSYILSTQTVDEQPLQWSDDFDVYVRLVNVMPKDAN